MYHLIVIFSLILPLRYSFGQELRPEACTAPLPTVQSGTLQGCKKTNSKRQFLANVKSKIYISFLSVQLFSDVVKPEPRRVPVSKVGRARRAHMTDFSPYYGLSNFFVISLSRPSFYSHGRKRVRALPGVFSYNPIMRDPPS